MRKTLGRCFFTGALLAGSIIALRAGAPLIVSDARPLPTEPKMKFESRDSMRCCAGGYTTLIASGPSTIGIAGSGGAGEGSSRGLATVSRTGAGLGETLGAEGLVQAPRIKTTPTGSTRMDRTLGEGVNGEKSGKASR